MVEYVQIVSVEDDDDLIVSFGLGPFAATTLILLRTPKFEVFLPEEDRGVSVADANSSHEDNERLVAVEWRDRVVQIVSSKRRYELDIHAIDPVDIKLAKKVLRKMNFDRCFEIKGG